MTTFGLTFALWIGFTSSMSISSLMSLDGARFELKFLLVWLLLLFSGDLIGDGVGECCWWSIVLSHDFGELLSGLGNWWCWRPASDRTWRASKPLFIKRAWCSWAFARRQAMELFLKNECDALLVNMDGRVDGLLWLGDHKPGLLDKNIKS